MIIKKLIDVAAKREKADLILKNALIVNVFSGNIQKGDIAICGGMIAAVGNYDNSDNITDCDGQYAMPGFIDSHVHMESSHLTPAQFARAVIPCGTTAVIADPHEIANVCGLKGIEYIYEESKKTPLDVYIMFPSCVPATPFETSGAELNSNDFKKHLNKDMFFGVGELMNFPAVVNANGEILKKTEYAHKYGKIIDGHASGLNETELNAYIAAGIKTNHECTEVSDMLQMLDRGLYIQLREGSAAKNLKELVKGVSPQNSGRILMCTDDKTPADILSEGHINYNIRLATENGMPFYDAVRAATINAANCYGLKNIGAIAPGYHADIVLCDDIKKINITQVYKSGDLVAKDGKPLFCVQQNIPKNLLNTVNTEQITEEKLRIVLKGNNAKVIKLDGGSIITQKVIREVSVKEGCFEPSESLNKLVVSERHKKTGNVGLAILEGYGIKGGAVATTVAHDSHNIIAAGDNDGDIITAIDELKICGGGITIASNNKILYTLPLNIAGLICDKTADDFAKAYSKLIEIACNMGVSKQTEPFMSLSFLSLAVLPHLKVTDKGLFDADSFSFTQHDA